MRYKDTRISHAVTVLIINLAFFIEDPYGVGYTVDILLFPKLSLSAGSEAVLVAQRWYIALDSSTLTTYTDTASLLHPHNISPITGWESTVSMLEQWAVFFSVMLRLPDNHT